MAAKVNEFNGIATNGQNMYIIIINQKKTDLSRQLSKHKECLIAVAANNSSYRLADAITIIKD